MLKNLLSPLTALFVFALAMFGGAAHAAPPDFTPITSAIDLSTVSGVIMSVAAIMAGIYVVWKGAKFALGALRGL